ncbi:hypothetical protein V8C44DRAFT_335431 [Trichoderma aethiopicum]
MLCSWRHAATLQECTRTMALWLLVHMAGEACCMSPFPYFQLSSSSRNARHVKLRRSCLAAQRGEDEMRQEWKSAC